MDDKRYNELTNDFSLNLTKSEVEKGWHWCISWDDMLVGPDMEEAFFCSCDVPGLEKWKQTNKAILMKQQMDDRLDALDKLDADEFNKMFRETDGE